MTTSISDAGVQFADNSVQASSAAPQILPILASVASNALTVTLGACSLAFRSSTLGSGASSIVTNSGTLTLTVPASATLGTVSAVQSRIVVLAINNAGTMELAVVNLFGGNDLSETGVISTSALSAGSTASNIIYSTTARTGVAYRVIGYIESTQATAGTWATAPSTVQGEGGHALDFISLMGQTGATVTRTAGVTYYNTTSRMKFLMVHVSSVITGTPTVYISINGGTAFLIFYCPPIGSQNVGGSGGCPLPPYCSYVLTDGALVSRTTTELG